MPEIQPELVGHWQGWPEMPGLMAQHQPPGMTQIVPGGVAGCAKDGEAERAPRAKITPTSIVHGRIPHAPFSVVSP